MILKKCSKCQNYKPTHLFYRNSQTKDGYHGNCKECKAKIHKIYMQDPDNYKKVVAKIKEWEKGHGREKYKALRKKYDSSEKRKEWRRKRFFACNGKRVETLEEALEELKKIRTERGLPV